VGIDAHAKGHRIYWPDKRTVTVERNVRFEGESEDFTYPSSVPIEGEMGGNSARNTRTPPAAPPDAAPEAPSDKSVPENSPAATDAPSAAPDAPDLIADAPPATPETIRPPSPAPTPESSRPSRTRKPTQWLRDIAEGTGSTGGRGAAKIPESVVPTRDPTANTVFATEAWLHGAFAFTAVRAVVAGNEVPSLSTSTRAVDAPPTCDANLKTYPTDKQGESAEEEKDGVTKSGHYDVRGPNILFSSFHHRCQCETNDNAESQDTPPIAEGHHQAYSIDHTESTHTAAPARYPLRHLPQRERHNRRPHSSEAQPKAHTPGHHPTDPTPSRSHRSPIARGNNRLRTKHVILCYHHIRQAIDAGTIPLSRAATDDPTVDELIKLLVCTNLR
jgi:hypothetical protein